MFGHVDRTEHWARHLLAIRRLQEKTGGFTELVPLPFVHMEAPIYFKGRARRGPTWREAVLMHAIARLALNPVIPNIQVSWVKMGVAGAKVCLQAGANDLGGTLMNESISRSAGSGEWRRIAARGHGRYCGFAWPHRQTAHNALPGSTGRSAAFNLLTGRRFCR